MSRKTSCLPRHLILHIGSGIPVSGLTFSFLRVPSGHTCTADTTDFRGGVWGATSLNGKFTVGPAIQIRFKRSDLSFLETHPLTPGLSPTLSTSATASVTSASTTAPSSVMASGGGLPTTGAPSTTSPTGGSSATSISRSSDTSTDTAAAHATSSQAALAQNTPSTASQPGNDNQTARHVDLAAIVASILIIIFAMCLILLVRIRRRRSWFRQHVQRRWGISRRKPKGLVPVGLGVWVGTRSSEEYTRSPDPDPPPRGRRIVSWDTETGPPVLTLDFEKQPLGSLENPAELDSEDTALSRRASWMSRMLSIMARSSTTTRSSSLSRWTQRSLATSGDWERFIHPRRRERDDIIDSAFLTVPEATYSRPTTMSSSTTNGDKVLGRMNSMLAIPKVRSFDRLSQGTFGKVTVRPHSYHSNPSSNSKNLEDSWQS